MKLTLAQQDELELLALKAIGDGEDFVDFDGDVHDAVRKILAAALPAHREQIAQEVEAHAERLMAAAVEQVIKGKDEGFSATLRAAAISSTAKFVRGEA